jgi:CRP-like cAMP-binding protein
MERSDPPRWDNRRAERARSSNALLRTLRDQDFQTLVPTLARARVRQHASLFRAAAAPDYVYFPETAVVSINGTLRDGHAVPIGTSGREGLAGLHIFLGNESPSVDAVVEIGGAVWRVGIDDFRRLVAESASFQRMLLMYTEAVWLEGAQTAACNAMHRVNERCARWLLTARDRVGGGTLRVSSHSMASMLGTHPDGVTTALRALQDAAIVRLRGARLEILDLAALEAASCPCYRLTRERFDRLAASAG